MDALDRVVFAEGLLLADVVHRFLGRMSTQRLIDARLFDADVIDALIEANDRMWIARIQRLIDARMADTTDTADN